MKTNERETGYRPVARSLPSEIRAQILPERGWEFIAAHELQRMKLEATTYRIQLENRPGAEQLTAAIEALGAAREAILGNVEGGGLGRK